jgi:hypothetical protein
MLGRITLGTLLTFVAFAADVSGKWKTVLHAPNGQTFEAKLTLKAEGQKLTGTLAGQYGEVQIQDGVVDGDSISFKIVRNQRANEYKGEVKGDTMKLVVKDGEREATITGTREAN